MRKVVGAGSYDGLEDKGEDEMEEASKHGRNVWQALSDRMRLPDVEGNYLAFLLDERGEERQGGRFTQIFSIELGDMEIWKEAATWESAWRVRVFRDILKGRYGSRFKSITITSKEHLYLWGDRDTGPTAFFENGPGPRIVKAQPGREGKGTTSPVPGNEPEAAGRLLAELLVGSGEAASILKALLNDAPSRALVEALGSESLKYARPEIAATPGCPVELLRKWATDPSRHTRRGVALNSATPVGILSELADDPDMYVGLAVAENSSTPADVLVRLLDRHRDLWSSYDFETTVARNTGAPADILEEVVLREAIRDDEYNAVACWVVENPSCPPALRRKIYKEREVPVPDEYDKAAKASMRKDDSPLPYDALLASLESEDQRYEGYDNLPYQPRHVRRSILELVMQSLPGYEAEIAGTLLAGMAD